MKKKTEVKLNIDEMKWIRDSMKYYFNSPSAHEIKDKEQFKDLLIKIGGVVEDYNYQDRIRDDY